MRIHDPRIRSGSRGSIVRNGDGDRSGGLAPGTQVRDPRRRPQLRTPTAPKQVCLLFELCRLIQDRYWIWFLL